MRIIRFVDPQGRIHWGTPYDDQQARILAGDLFNQLTPTDQLARISQLLSPLTPTNIFCIGANYAEHAKEAGHQTPERPIIFMKPTSSVNHPGQPILIPRCQMRGAEVDFEAELAVVIGKTAKNVSVDKALDYVLGYTCGHDVSARRWQKEGGGGQWIRGKGFDTFCPLGPVLMTKDEIPDPQTLDISFRLNGQVMQQSNTANMIFSVAFLISFISQDTTLLPGTVIMTGTPEGVGAARDPKVFLKAGDVTVVEIKGIGKLENPVADAP